jgi:hypothetical protein
VYSIYGGVGLAGVLLLVALFCLIKRCCCRSRCYKKKPGRRKSKENFKGFVQTIELSDSVIV